MTKWEVDDVLNSMIVLVDTREQPTDRARRRYQTFGCGYRRATLAYGDYTYNYQNKTGKWRYDENETISPDIMIERKMNLDELARCFAQDRDRFIREMERAKAAGADIYLIVEGATWENLINGKYRSRFNAKAYFASIVAWQIRYSMKVIFCKPDTSGTIIKEILFRKLKEKLESKDRCKDIQVPNT